MSFVVVLLLGMVLIVLSADYFTNSVEWLGYQWGLGEGVSGSLLAALGTALPETLVPLMAVVFARPSSTHEAIGLGAILGAPFMLATLGFSIIGIGLFANGRAASGLKVVNPAMLQDLRFFLGAFLLAIISAFLPAKIHPVMAFVLVMSYGIHAWRLVHVQKSIDELTGPPEVPLHFSRSPRPNRMMVGLQVIVALSGLIVGAHFFVSALEQVTGWIHIAGFLVAVIVTPLATELPEVLNSVIWIRRGKDRLAVGNVTGAMAFQASLVPAIGILFTPWRFSTWEMVTAILAWLAALWIFQRSRDGILQVGELFAAGLFYVLFILLVVAVL